MACGAVAAIGVFVRHDVTTGSIAFFRHVHVGVQVEKVVWHELKARVYAVLNGKVLAAHGMVQAKGVPGDNVRIDNAAPLLNVMRQATFAVRLVDILTRRVALFFVIRSYPQVLVGPCHALTGKRIGITEDLDGLRWFELVPYRVTGVVGLVGIHKFPITFRVGIASKAAFGAKSIGLDEKGISKGVCVGVCWFHNSVTFHHSILVSIDRHVETCTKVMLVDLAYHARAHFSAPLLGVPGMTRDRVL